MWRRRRRSRRAKAEPNSSSQIRPATSIIPSKDRPTDISSNAIRAHNSNYTPRLYARALSHPWGGYTPDGATMDGFFSSPRRAISLVSGAEYDRETAAPLPWLWKPYLAFGAVSILDGDPGVGKSLLAVDIAARISRHRCMPDFSAAVNNPITGGPLISTVFVNAEDSVRYTQMPRFLAAGGEPKLALFVGGIGEGDGRCAPLRLPLDSGYLAGLLSDKFHLKGSFVILDPLMALFPRLAASDSAVRAAIDPLAPRGRYAVLHPAHPAPQQTRRKAISLSGRWKHRHPRRMQDRPARWCPSRRPGAARPVDDEIESRSDGPFARLARRQHARADRAGDLRAGDEHPVTGGKNEELTTIDRRIPPAPAIVSRRPRRSRLTTSSPRSATLAPVLPRAAWLQSLLAKGPVPATVVEARAQAEGIGYATVRAVKTKLRIESRRTILDGQPRWEWMLPDGGEEGAVAPDLLDLPSMSNVALERYRH